MANEADMSSWTDLLHSSSKLVEQAAPSAQFPPLQRNLDQLEALSKKLKSKTLRTEAPSQSIAATRLLAREGLNAEQLARDLKSFELKTTYEDVFPAEATSVEEYLQQVHEMAMVSAVQEAQKDNVRSFNDYMMTVLEEDWKKEKRDFLQSLSRITSLPRTNVGDSSPASGHYNQIVSAARPHLSPMPSRMELPPLADKSVAEKKAAVYAQTVKTLNDARERGLPFKPATAFKSAYESLNLDTSGGKSVSMQKIWYLIQTMVGEDSNSQQNVSKKMSLIIGARRHLEWGHEKHVIETIQSHPAQAALGGAVGKMQRIRAFLRIRLRDYGVLDFDAGDTRRQPPVDTTWQQALEEVEKNFAIMRVMLSGDGEVEPNPDQIAQLTLEICKEDGLTLLMDKLPLLKWEARKDLVHCWTILMRQQVGSTFCCVQYIENHLEFLDFLVVGYDNKDIALTCGSMLRECIRVPTLAKYVLESPSFEIFFKYVELPNFDVASDAFSTFKDLLTKHETVVAEFLTTHYDEFFDRYETLLTSRNYVTRRQSLKLLSEFLLELPNPHVMKRYIAEVGHLKVMMTLLKDSSKNIQISAFHVFKVFVANPNKPREIKLILAKNHEKLLELLHNLSAGKGADDDQFEEEKELIIKEIERVSRLPNLET